MAVITPMSGRAIGAQLRDLAEAAHAHLDDADLGVGLEPAERQRHAELVVEAALGRDRARDRRAERGEDVLRRRLAGRARDPDDPRVASVAHRPGDRRERGEGTSCGTSVAAAPRSRASCMNSRARPDRDEEVAGLDAARVDLDAGHLTFARRAHPRPSRRSSSMLSGIMRAESWSERLAGDDSVVERQLLAVDLLALLVPLACDHDDVARLREPDRAARSRCAGRDRSRRSRLRPEGCPR